MVAVSEFPKMCVQPSEKTSPASPSPSSLSPSSLSPEPSSSPEPNNSTPEPPNSRKRITPEPGTLSSPKPDPDPDPEPNPNAHNAELPTPTPPKPTSRRKAPPPPPTAAQIAAAFGEEVLDDLPSLTEPEPEPLNMIFPSYDLYPDMLCKDWSSSSWINKFDEETSVLGPAPSSPEDDYDGPFRIRTNLDSLYRRTRNFEIGSGSSSLNSTPFDYYGYQSDALPTSPSSKLVGAGISNLGNTCFMSAILQCFTHTVQLFLGLRYSTHNSPCNVVGFCAICAFRQHMNACLEPSRNPVLPTTLADNLNQFSSSFRKHQQEDAHEFMQCALNKLQRCFPIGEDNLVDQIFGGRLVSKLRCCCCGHTSDTFEPIIDLSLEIEDANTIQCALESFTMVEKMDSKFTCSNCNEVVTMEKQLMLDKAPSVAAFHLKRFKKDGDTVKKVDSHVYFTKDLDLQPYTSANGSDIVPLKYDLYAVVEHRGSSPNSGHYFCFVRSSPDKWHLMDDSMVSSVFEEEVLTHEAYILFYARQGTPWFSSVVENEEKVPNSSSDNKHDSDEGQKGNKHDSDEGQKGNKHDSDEGQNGNKHDSDEGQNGNKHDSDEEPKDNKHDSGEGQKGKCDSTEAYDKCVTDMEEDEEEVDSAISDLTHSSKSS